MPKIRANKYREVEREFVPAFAPEGTETHKPVPHNYILSAVENSIYAGGYEKVDERHYVSHGDDRFLGKMQIRNSYPEDLVVAVVNSHDKSYAARILAGMIIPEFGNMTSLARPTVFFKTVNVFRKHTKFIERDFPARVAQATTQILEAWGEIGKRFETYRNYEFQNIAYVHDAMIQMLKQGAFAPSAIPKVLKEFQAESERYNLHLNPPGSYVFRGYELFAAVARVQNADTNPFTLPERSQALFGVIDQITGYDLKIAAKTVEILGM